MAVAQLLAQAANAELYEIQPEAPYTDADLNWRDSLSRSSVEMRDADSRPALDPAKLPIDVAAYDTLFIGFPIWWAVAPRIINTFIEAADLKGKVVFLMRRRGL
jgi:hypothetical protein